MIELFLFTDGSVNVQSKVGCGAYLAISDLDHSIEYLKEQVKIKFFEETSSSKLEIQALLWALSALDQKQKNIIIYTDSQNIIGLPGRRHRFESNNYKSKQNKTIRHKKLYQEFYRIMDQLNLTLIKVDGHKSSHDKSQIDKLFTLVDKASRKALRAKN